LNLFQSLYNEVNDIIILRIALGVIGKVHLVLG